MLEQYPYKGFRFKVEIGGVIVAGFNEVTGFDATFDIVEYREGDAADNTPRKQPGLVKYSNVTFKRGVIDAIEFFAWIDEIDKGTITNDRKNITIQLLNDEESLVAAWQLLRAWPCKYTGPELKGLSSDIAMETIEFAHEGLVRLDV
ncbi:MAG: phage tail protein [Anaerotignaceae bacterium]